MLYSFISVGAYNLAGSGSVTKNSEKGKFEIHVTAESVLKGGDAEMVMSCDNEVQSNRWFSMIDAALNGVVVDLPDLETSRRLDSPVQAHASQSAFQIPWSIP